MNLLDVFRHKPDGSFVWIGCTDSMNKARELIESCAADASEEFLIYDAKTTETITLRADRSSMRLSG